MNLPTIATQHLFLRQFVESDTDTLHQVFNEDDILKYFPNPAPPAREKIAKLIQAQINHWKEHGYGWWAVEPLGDQRLIGWAGLQYLPDTDETEVAYMLSKSFWGRGLATEAAIASLEFGFGSFPFESIVGITHPDNLASQRVLEKSGLIFTLRTEYFGMDCFRFIIKREDFDASRSK